MIQVSDSYLLGTGNPLLTDSPGDVRRLPSALLECPLLLQYLVGQPRIFQALKCIKAALLMRGAHPILLVYKCDSREKGCPGIQRFLGL